MKIFIQQFLFVMNWSFRIIAFMVLFTTVLFAKEGEAQVKSVKEIFIDINFNQVSVIESFELIEKGTDLNFSYDKRLIRDLKTVDYTLGADRSLEHFFLYLSENYDLSFRQVNNTVSVQERKVRQPSDVQIFIDQTNPVQGVIMDENGEPLPGATVLEKGTSNGTITGIDGNFQLSVADGAILLVSFVGYMPREVVIGGQSKITIALEPDIESLQEVVVVGYGTQKKVNLTGSVEQIAGKTLTDQPVFQVSSALIGAAPGLTIIQSSGQPGRDNSSIRIRGVGSLGSGKNDPLVLIDGVQGDIDAIDPGDIQDISVLKDAAASSIYGSRAANGVILITTKRGQSGQISVSYKNSIGFQKATDMPKFVGAVTFLENDGNTSQDVIDDYKENLANGTNPDIYTDTDWVDLLYTESGFMQNHQISLQGGNENIKAIASLSYSDQNGNIPNYNFKRYNGRLNTDIRASEMLDFNFDINFSQKVIKEPVGGLSNISRAAFRIPPIYYARHSDGSWGSGWAGGNPIAYARDGGLGLTEVDYFRSILKMNLKPAKGLKISFMYAPEYINRRTKSFVKPYEYMLDYEAGITQINPDRSSLSQLFENTLTHNLNGTAVYSLTKGDHDITALVGYEMIKRNFSQVTAYRDQFILPTYQVLNAGSTDNATNTGTETHNALLSYFGRLNYSYKNKYLVEGVLRSDQSSRFAPQYRSSYFPSVSVGWRIAEEPFLSKSSIVSDLKLRASWGQLGNQEIGSDFPYVSSMSLSGSYLYGNTMVTTATQAVLANTGIQWETTTTSNLGIDAAFLDSRLSMTAEYYIRKTDDILLEIPIPLNLGLLPSYQNAGAVENQGYDISLGWRDHKNDFNYTVNVMYSDFINEVTDLAGVGPIIEGAAINQVGSPANSIYGYATEGIFQTQEEIDNAPTQFGTLQPGNLRYKDQLTVDTDGDGIPDAGDGRINSDDRVVLGNSMPRKSYTVSFGAEYKGFDLSMVFVGVGKRDIRIEGDASWALFNGGKIQEWHMKETWTPERPNAKYPIMSPTSAGSNDIQTSSTWIFDGAYLRLRNVNLGYTLPENVLGNSLVRYARFYVSGQNLITWDKLFPGMDPMVPSGTGGNFYPIMSSYTFGVDVKF